MSRDRHHSSAPSNPTRRKLLSTGAIGVAAATTAAVFGAPATAQNTTANVTTQVSPEGSGEFTGQCAFITGGA